MCFFWGCRVWLLLWISYSVLTTALAIFLSIHLPLWHLFLTLFRMSTITCSIYSLLVLGGVAACHSVIQFSCESACPHSWQLTSLWYSPAIIAALAWLTMCQYLHNISFMLCEAFERNEFWTLCTCVVSAHLGSLGLELCPSLSCRYATNLQLSIWCCCPARMGGDLSFHLCGVLKIAWRALLKSVWNQIGSLCQSPLALLLRYLWRGLGYELSFRLLTLSYVFLGALLSI